MAETYTVKKNDCFASISKKFGFADYKIIYNHAQNAELKRKRPNPNLLVEGDKVFIPDKNLGEEACSTEQLHNFVLKRPKVKLRIVVKDDQGKHIADKKYELKIGEKMLEGSTDGQGFIEKEIPAETTRAQLKVFTGDEKLKVLSWDLSVGELEPSETNLGVQARLHNLGFYYGRLDGKVDTQQSKSSIETYQGKNTMTKTGNVDDALRNKLRDSHDVKS